MRLEPCRLWRVSPSYSSSWVKLASSWGNWRPNICLKRTNCWILRWTRSTCDWLSWKRRFALWLQNWQDLTAKRTNLQKSCSTSFYLTNSKSLSLLVSAASINSRLHHCNLQSKTRKTNLCLKQISYQSRNSKTKTERVKSKSCSTDSKFTKQKLQTWLKVKNQISNSKIQWKMLYLHSQGLRDSLKEVRTKKCKWRLMWTSCLKWVIWRICCVWNWA